MAATKSAMGTACIFLSLFRLIPNEGGWRGWRVGLGVGVEVFT